MCNHSSQFKSFLADFSADMGLTVEFARFIFFSAHSCFVCFSFRGQTALHKAALYERRTICSLLVQAGASLTRTDYDVSNRVKLTHAKLRARLISILYLITGDILTL